MLDYSIYNSEFKINPAKIKLRLLAAQYHDECDSFDNKNLSIDGVDDSRITSIVNSVFRQKEQGKLKPIPYNKVRRIIFKKGLKWSKEEYSIVIGREMKNMYQIKSTNKLQDIIDNWDFNNGLISQRNICKFGKMSLVTIKKYYSQYKDQIEDMNKNYKLFLQK